MFLDDDETGGEYVVNLPQVAKSTDCLAITRLLATKIMNQPYMTVEEFLNGLSDADVSQLVEVINDQDKNFEDLLLMAEMVAGAEGVGTSSTFETLRFRMAQLSTFIIIESLARKGLCRAFRQNMSFGDDMADKQIAEKL
jgi:predicted transcriptional regulator